MAFAPNGLLQAEQGPNSDDEINLVVKGGNYGWPNVAGYKDDSGYAYANYSAATNKSQIKDLGQNGIKVAAGVPVTKSLNGLVKIYCTFEDLIYRSGYL